MQDLDKKKKTARSYAWQECETSAGACSVVPSDWQSLFHTKVWKFPLTTGNTHGALHSVSQKPQEKDHIETTVQHLVRQ